MIAYPISYISGQNVVPRISIWFRRKTDEIGKATELIVYKKESVSMHWGQCA